MLNIRKIIEKVGGLTKAAKLFNVPVSTIQYWKEKNSVPVWREEMIKRVLSEVQPNDFYHI